MYPGDIGIIPPDYGKFIKENMEAKEAEVKNKIVEFLEEQKNRAHGFYGDMIEWMKNYVRSGKKFDDEGYKRVLEKVGEVEGVAVDFNRDLAKEILERLGVKLEE